MAFSLPAMFTEIRYPQKVSPARLDLFLEQGWRPMGQAIYTGHFSFFDEKIPHSTICIRLPLRDYAFRKSLRKLKSKNERRFRHTVQKAQISKEKELLNKLYQKDFPDRAPTDLHHHIGYHGQQVFTTYETNVYEDDKLVAFSFFDRGERGIYSRMGIYNPEYSEQSLGFYTMLLEIQYGVDQGIQHYYPGYVSPTYPMFDYKLRVGESRVFSICVVEIGALI